MTRLPAPSPDKPRPQPALAFATPAPLALRAVCRAPPASARTRSALLACAGAQRRPARSDGAPAATMTRRCALAAMAGWTALPLAASPARARVTVADPDAGARVVRTSSGLQYYDFVTLPSVDVERRAGGGAGGGDDGAATQGKQAEAATGAEMAGEGSRVTIHYTLGTTGARNGWRIESSREPLTFRVGEHAVVAGLEEGVVGMRVGGRRRLLIPAVLGYLNAKDRPIPVGFAEFQRFKNLYLNPNIPYKPDVVMDVTLLKVR